MSNLYRIDPLESWGNCSALKESEPCKPLADLIDGVVAPEMEAERKMIVAAMAMSA
jgi:hypothetical protein